jgi:mannose-1-phosphate guanylyltransferase
MFKATVFVAHSENVLSEAEGKTATAAITAAAKPVRERQVNTTVGVRVSEKHDDDSWAERHRVFTAYDYGVAAAIKTAHGMNRKSRSGGGR